MHASGSRVIELLIRVQLSVRSELLNVILKSTSSTPDIRTVIFWFAACLPDRSNPIRFAHPLAIYCVLIFPVNIGLAFGQELGYRI